MADLCLTWSQTLNETSYRACVSSFQSLNSLDSPSVPSYLVFTLQNAYLIFSGFLHKIYSLRYFSTSGKFVLLHEKSYILQWKQYVGETKGPLNIRMNGHRDDWRHKRFERSPVGEHFCSSGHGSHASVCCMDSNPEWTDNARKSHESYWIRRLNTLQPSGINKGD